MRKSILWAALLSLVFLAGCASELAFVKNNKIYTIKDDGNDLRQVGIQQTEGDRYFRPDVSHDGRELAFVSTLAFGPLIEKGAIYRVRLDGTDLVRLVPMGTQASTPKWSPNGQFVAYYVGEITTNGIFQIGRNGGSLSRIANTGSRCNGGHDYYAGGARIIFSHWMADGSYKLYTTAVTGSAMPVPINPYLPTSVVTQDMFETLPAVSFAGDMLASAVRYPGLVGIRMRAMGTDGNWGPPFTMKLPVAYITGVSFSDKDEKVYFSALPQPGQPQALYDVSIKELLPTITGLLTLPPGSPPPAPVDVTPRAISAGAGENYWPSGIVNP